MKYFALLTKLGENLLAQATALGTKLELTHMAVGDGGGSLPTPDTNQTKLIAEKRRAAINTLFIDDKNKNQIIAEQIIPEQDGGWWIREIGLFDKAGNLIAVANCPETYKPQLAEGSGRTQAIRMILVVSHTESVTLKIDPSVVLATRKYVDDLITSLDIKLQKQIDNKVNKAGDNVTGTLKFNGVAPLTYDIESLTGNKDEIANYLRRFRHLYNSTIFHEIVTGGGIQIATGTAPTNIIYSLSSSGSITLKGRVIPADFLDFNQRYLGINNPAIAAKKLDKPSRIAGHTFQGQGEDIKITPTDIGAQPTGDYATNTALNNGLNQKFDKTGGTINGNVAVTSDIQGAQVRAKTAGDSQINLNPASTEGPRIEHKTKGGTWYAHLLPNATGTLMQVGDLGFGAGRKSNATDTITIKNFNDADRTAVYKSDDLTENARFTYSPMLNMTRRGGADGTGFCSQIQVDSHTGILSSRGGASGGRFSGWMDAYSPANTIKDRNGNLKVSGSSNELSDYPVGAPIPWPQATAPAGFLVCNGQSFNKTTYPLLAKAYPTGILPDLRGEFLRGLDTGRGVDSGRAVLSAQGDAFRAHNHSVIGEDSGSGTAYFGRGNGSRRTISKDAMNLEGGTETRPRNIAFLYIVRAA
ncbi:phage tail protein [Providencia rettgeri]|uniref:phage tail-collar fiber domain-containing protein n=1 Tax=Providencia rettgeri TaxID=587 RepID=UPI001655F101|nr:phage tail protein [Providencia rettgeri]QNN31417.1 phage tail protein [Providencia rettgeri]